METFTRVAFCEHCYKDEMPAINEYFVVFGKSNNSFIVKKAIKNGVRGFTPHIFEPVKVENEIVFYTRHCGFCSIIIEDIDQKNEVCKITFIEKEVEIMPIHSWNELVKYKDETFRV